jgi:hypothetical protein
MTAKFRYVGSLSNFVVVVKIVLQAELAEVARCQAVTAAIIGEMRGLL